MEYTRVYRYELKSVIWAGGINRNPSFTHHILLTSETLYHGIVVKVDLYFSTFWDGWLGDQIGFVDNRDFYQPVISVWFRLSEYQYYYDILRQENPVFFGYQQSGSPLGIYGSFYIDQFELITHKEPTGEGSGEHLRPVLRLNQIVPMPNEIREIMERANQADLEKS